jgi:acyl-coenzyme A synthetase/AMP-(fatty) acid ligase
MRFVDFLYRDDWTAAYRGEHLDATVARALCTRATRMLHEADTPAGAARLTVFCAFTPIEILMSYFIASRLGLLAAVQSPRTLGRFLADLDPGLAPRIVVPRGHKLPDVLCTHDVTWIDLRTPEDADEPAGAPGCSGDSECRLVFCTSGTTGKPKRIVCAESRLVANAAMVSTYLGLQSTDRTLCAFPVNFMYGLSTTLCTLLTGGYIEYCDFLDPRALASMAAGRRTTVLPLLGDWAAALAERWAELGFRPERLLLLNASDRLLVQHAHTLLPFASALWNNFGQTESGPRLFAINLSEVEDLDRVAYRGTLAPGYPAGDGIELRIDAAEGENGFARMSYRTPYAMLGYLEDDGQITPVDGWIDSGDLFRRLDDGVYVWAGRVAHTVKVNGQFVSLRALADDLLHHDSVTAVGYAGARLDDLCLFVESPNPPSGLGVTLTSYVSRMLRGRQAAVRVVPTLPRTESGKIDFKQLNQAMLAEQNP